MVTRKLTNMVKSNQIQSTVKQLSPVHSGDNIDSHQNRRKSPLLTLSPILLTLLPICHRFVKSRLSLARSTLSTMSQSTLSTKLNMFNSLDFVKSGQYLSPECRTSFRLCLQCTGSKQHFRLCCQYVPGFINAGDQIQYFASCCGATVTKQVPPQQACVA